MKIIETFGLASVALSAATFVACRQSNKQWYGSSQIDRRWQRALRAALPGRTKLFASIAAEAGGGIEGMVGKVAKSFHAKEIDDQTPVDVISSDDNAALVKISQGPTKGQTAFAAKQNVD